MNDYKDLEEANKEIEASKIDLHASNDKQINDEDEKTNEQLGQEEENESTGSGLFTADGEELPNIEGGYDVIEPGGSLGDDDFVSI